MRRNDYDIMADLLRVATGGAKKTQLVYRANLNFNIIKRYLKRLIDGGLIKVSGRMYYSTDEATQFLKKYDLLLTSVPIPEVASSITFPQEGY